MRDEQYYALANLVKRPMRRWWAKVGSWWLVGLGLLLVVQAWQAANNIQSLQAGTFPTSAFMSSWYQLANTSIWTIPTLSIGVSLLCAFYLIALIDKIAHETPAFSEPTLRLIKYKLALLNCRPAMIPVFLAMIIFNFDPGVEGDGTFYAWLFVSDSISYMFHHSLWVVWLVAVAVVTPSTRWATWVLFSGGLLANSARELLLASTLYGVQLFPAYWLRDLSSIQVSILKGIGLFLIYGMFYLYLVKRARSANLVCLGLSLFLLLDGIQAGFSILFLDHLLQVGKYLTNCIAPMQMVYHPGFRAATEPSLFMWVLGFSMDIPASPAWAIVPVMNGIFWFFAHFFAFSWLMGRDWRKKKRRIEG